MTGKRRGFSLALWKTAQGTVLVFSVFFTQQLPGVSGAGVDLPLIFTVLAGLRTTPARAAGWGFLMGFLQDALSAGWVGPRLISKTLIGILSSVAQKHTYREKVMTQSFLVFCMVALEQFVVWMILRWDGSAPDFSNGVSVMEKSILGTSLAGILACFIVVRLRRRRLDPATA